MRNLNWSAENRRSFFIWILFCAISGLTLLAYAGASLAAGRGVLVMPLDDVYIHFQYARQLANGQPYVYNPGLPPSSGATSLLYPYLLAIGYLLGFQGLNLGLWAMLTGYAALAGSAWLVYQLVRGQGGAVWLALCVALAFEINGSIAWHFMSGMETGIVVWLSLWVVWGLLRSTEYRVLRKRRNAMLIIAATLMALVRPEGAVLAVLAVGVLVFTPPLNPLPVHGEGGLSRPIWRNVKWWWGIPVLAVVMQPLVNLLLTGSAVASGNAAKSVLGIVPFEWGEAIRRIVENFGRIWWEFLTGISPREGLYIAPLMLVLAGLGIFSFQPSAVSRQEKESTEYKVLSTEYSKRLWLRLVLVGWLVGGTAMIATLDTAFWHFKRYQIPFMALLFPLAGIGLAVLQSRRPSPLAPLPQGEGDKTGHPEVKKTDNLTLLTASLYQREGDQDRISVAGKDEAGNVIANLPSPPDRVRVSPRRGGAESYMSTLVVYGTVLVMELVAVWTSGQFWGHYLLNAGYVYEQPLQMARWLEANTPTEALVAVHDTGMMRYMGGRTTLDMVGLTTAGAADYWRNGPGAVAEFLMREQPDYVASYGPGHGFGLGMVADTAVYGELLAGFPVNLDGRYNVALAADFQGIYQPDWATATAGMQLHQMSLQGYIQDAALLDAVNVADIASERAHNYHWRSTDLAGFPTEPHEFDTLDCAVDCRVTDGGRRINSAEIFTISVTAGEPLLLITRVHPAEAGSFDVYANDVLVERRVVPALPGSWLEIPSLIPAELVSAETTIRIVPYGLYQPYRHWVYSGEYARSEVSVEQSVATYQDSAIVLSEASVSVADAQLSVNLAWATDGTAQGDYVVFVHVYDDVNAAPIAQADMRPGNGTLPPGNWLPGVLRDTIMVDLNTIPTGTYQVAIGFYDPVTLERLMPTGGDEHGRLFIGDVEIKP